MRNSFILFSYPRVNSFALVALATVTSVDILMISSPAKSSHIKWMNRIISF